MTKQFLVETNFSEVKSINEDVGGEKQWYIQGPFAQHSVVNRNRRIYPQEVMSESMTSYRRDFFDRNQAVGELSHPPTTVINPERVAIKIVEMNEDGNAYMGKAKVLNTPCGKIIQGLLEGGVQIGVSTRADGSVKKNGQGIMEVQTGLRMSAIDAVFSPSGPDCFVQGIMEGADYIWDTMNEDVQFVESIRNDILKASSRNLQEAKLQAFQKFMNRIRGL